MSSDADDSDAVYGSYGPAQAPGEPVEGCSGHVGQITNIGAWLAAALAFVIGAYIGLTGPYPFDAIGGIIAMLAVGYSAYRYYAAECHAFDIGAERLETRKGVFNKVSNNLQLYRVKDVQVREPFVYRPFGLGNVVVTSSDRSTPRLELEAIEAPHDVAEVIRKNTEIERLKKNVREID